MHPGLVQLCYLGRRELGLYAQRCELALGDSEYNRQELEVLGFPATGVLPVVPDFAHLSGPPNYMQAGTFDAGYTLEPNASTMRKMGIATTIEAGVIAHYILGDPDANAFAAGCALTSDFIKSRPDVAKRFAAAWGRAVELINSNPQEARKHLLKNTFTPDDVVDTVPMIRYFMAKDLTAKDKADYQKFIDFSVQAGTLSEKVDVSKYLQTF